MLTYISKKIKTIFRFLNPKNIAKEIHRYGYEFSMSAYIKHLLLIYAGIGVLAYFYRLNITSISVILITATLFIPMVFISTYRSMYEHKKFDDLINYMEQILYSFKRRNKILDSLMDTLALFPDGEMHDDIVKAIDYIQNANTDGNIFREALSFIEEDYGCKRLSRIHDFLIKVESTGGDYDMPIDILLSDRKLWADRVYAIEGEKKNIKNKVTIGIVISFLIGLMAVLILPGDLDVSKNTASQSVTTFVFLCNMAIWYITNQNFSGSLIHTKDSYTWKEMKHKYDIVFHSDIEKKKKKFLIIGIIMIPCAALMFYKFGIGAGIISLMMIYIIITQPGRQYKTAYKRVREEVEKAFPEWLLGMSLLLQTDNVHVALSKSIEDAPEILKEELRNLEEGIAQQPNIVAPYLKFMDKFDVSDIFSAMKILFSMAEYGAKDITKQIGALVERNSSMIDRAERLRAEDSLAIMSFFVLLPMVTGVFKLLTDLALIIFQMMNTVGNF